MASQVQYRRGTNAQNAAFTGALAEITVDTTNGTLRVHDAITVGGSNIATVAYVTSQISSLSSNSISFGTSSVAVIASGGNIRANVGGSTITNTYSSGLAVTGLISATGAVTAASVVGGVITGSSVSVTGAQTAASTVGGVITGSSVSVTGAVTGASLVGTVTTAAQGSITSVGTLSSLSVTANVQGGNIRTAGQVSATGAITAGGDLSLVGNIVDTGPLTIITTSNGNITLAPNGSGNINTGANIMPTANATANIGSATLSYNTIFAKATSAQYADLAEMYCADSEYTPGTVLEFGGSEEVTITTQSHGTQIAGIVSTNPSYLMNSTLTCVNAVQVALVGRVPCHVVGTIAKGDRLVASSTPGVATRLDMSQYQPGCIIGKALEAYNSETVGTIEVAVGRF
jgi:hypothetical protein